MDALHQVQATVLFGCKILTATTDTYPTQPRPTALQDGYGAAIPLVAANGGCEHEAVVQLQTLRTYCFKNNFYTFFDLTLERERYARHPTQTTNASPRFIHQVYSYERKNENTNTVPNEEDILARESTFTTSILGIPFDFLAQYAKLSTLLEPPMAKTNN